MRLLFFKSILLVTLFISCSSSNSNSIPFTQKNNITIDGLFGNNEWDKARTIELPSNNFLYLLQDDEFLFLGIQNKGNTRRYVDLYATNNSASITNLHASMQLGERELIGNWNDTIPSWNWGNNNGWKSNKVEILNRDDDISFLERLKPYKGHEFQISKEKIGLKEFKIRLEIKDFIGEASDITFPENSERNNAENWFIIEVH